MALGKRGVLALQLTMIGLAPQSCSEGKTVSTESEAEVATMEVTPTSLVLASVGDVGTLKAVARDGHGNVLSKSIIAWSSSDRDVVTVASGIVTAVDTGMAVIVASADGVTSNPVDVTVGAPTTGYSCTQVIGFSQTNEWFSQGFESLVGDGTWQLLWRNGAAIDRWADPTYAGWSEPIVSPCASDSGNPDRILLTISGDFQDDPDWWAENTRVAISNIRARYPNVRQIILQPVVGGPSHQICFPNGERASKNHPVIDDAIAIVAEADVVAGYSPEVRSCADYSDEVGHLLAQASEALAIIIGQYYSSR